MTIVKIRRSSNPYLIPITTLRIRLIAITVRIAAMFVILKRGKDNRRGAGALGIQRAVYRERAAAIEFKDRTRLESQLRSACHCHGIR